MLPISRSGPTKLRRREQPSIPIGAWSPYAINPVAWYDASNAASITSSGGLVSQWDDISGSGRHLAQATSSLQPTTGTTTQNGRNVIVFDGTRVLKNSTSIIDSDYTLISVFKVVTPGSSFVMPSVTLNSGNAGRPIERWQHPDFGNRIYFNDDGSFVVSNVDLRNWTTWKVWSYTYSKTTTVNPRLVEYENNVVKTTTNSSSPHVVTSQKICVGQRDDAVTTFNGHVAEIIIVPYIIPDGNRIQLHNYLAAKWGL